MSDILIECKIIHKTARATLFEDFNGRFWCPSNMYIKTKKVIILLSFMVI